MNKQYTINRDAKVLLLKAMQRGYFTEDERLQLLKILNAETLTIEVIDSREQVRKE